MTPEIHNGLTFEEAMAQVVGTKSQALKSFSRYATVGFDVEDIANVINIAIMKSWRQWDPVKSKLNTHVTNMINWYLLKTLEDLNPLFRARRKIKMNLSNNGESYKMLSKNKVTVDPEFNKLHLLDGVKNFTKELYNEYVLFTAMKEFGDMNILQYEIYDNADIDDDYYEFGDENDDFITMDTIPDTTTDKLFEAIEFESELKQMPSEVKKFYTMVNSGHTMSDSLKEAKISKYKLKMWQNKQLNSDCNRI